MRRNADEGEPVVVEPIEVGVTLRIVPPDVADLPLAPEHMYGMPSMPPLVEGPLPISELNRI